MGYSKYILILLCFTISSCKANAQTFAEWFQQKKTQIAYLINQIEAYRVYAEYLQKGYKIAQSGLTFISELKQGEFDLHNAFFISLKKINPSISKYSRIADIITYQRAISGNLKVMERLDNLSTSENGYLQSVANSLKKECEEDVDELLNLLTDETYGMDDGERITRINCIYQSVKDKFSFSKVMLISATELSQFKNQELNDIEMSSLNHGIK